MMARRQLSGSGAADARHSQAEEPYAKLRPAPPTPRDEICSCAPARPIMLMSALSDNPVHCLDCNLEVDPASLPLPEALVDAVAHWSWIAGAIHALELDSGPYEQWAQAELLDLESPVNQEGLALRQVLDATRRSYYVLFQPLDVRSGAFIVPEACPSCGRPFGAYSGARFPRLLCQKCSLVLVNT
jgi:hypothetical protein